MVVCALWYLEKYPPMCWFKLFWIHTIIIVLPMLLKRSIFITLCNVPEVLTACIGHTATGEEPFQASLLLSSEHPVGQDRVFTPFLHTRSEHTRNWLRLLRAIWGKVYFHGRCFSHWISDLVFSSYLPATILSWQQINWHRIFQQVWNGCK